MLDFTRAVLERKPKFQPEMEKQRLKWAKQVREQFGNDESTPIQECAGEKIAGVVSKWRLSFHA